MEKPFKAYAGDEPYVFVSYAHADADAVYPEIVWLHEQGFNVWYDEGIEPGSVWREALAQAIDRAALFIFFVSPTSIKRQHCQREIAYAIDHEFPFLAIHLEKTELDPTTELTLSSIQAILKFETTERDYRQQLIQFASRHLERGIADSKRAKQPTSFRPAMLGTVASLIAATAFVGGYVTTHTDDADPSALGPTAYALQIPASARPLVRAIPTHAGDALILSTLHGRGSKFSLWHMGQEAPIPINTGDDIAVSGFISPDDQWFGYIDIRTSTIKRVRLDGGDPVTVADTGMLPNLLSVGGSWWTDDDRIIFANASYKGVLAVPASGGVAEPFTESAYDVGWPQLFDDLLLYQQRDETVLRNLTSGATRTIEGHAQWMDGFLIIDRQDGGNWATRLSLDTLETGTAVPVDDWTTVTPNGSATSVPPVPPDDMVSFDRRGSAAAIPNAGSGYRAWPRASPRGDAIAFWGAFDDMNGQIWIESLRDGRRRQVMTTTDVVLVEWHTSGERLVYSSQIDGKDSMTLFSLATGEHTPLELKDSRSIKPMHWVTDELLIADRWDAESMDVVAVNPSTGEVTDLVATPFYEGRARLSPNGRWLAYHANSTGRNEIYVQPFPPRGVAPTLVSIDGGMYVLWSPDGDEIYYLRRDSIYAVGFDEREGVVQLTAPRIVVADGGFGRSFLARDYDITPDGNFVFFSYQDQKEPLLYRPNWSTELDKIVPPL